MPVPVVRGVSALIATGALIAGTAVPALAIDGQWPPPTGRPGEAVTVRVDGFGSGLGLMRLTLPCGPQIWGHKGHIPGYVTYSFHDDRRSLTVAANALHSPDDARTDQALNQALTAHFCPPARRIR
ncbi:hypothetical protein [Herbidospora cretacea]|uniref:hypothetical protein n=1 Tax=Herbidospora cretacea TaxID=28444 RepID=UPI0007734EFA|nr:hypothetical protein [Herbidospora cretacea]